MNFILNKTKKYNGEFKLISTPMIIIKNKMIQHLNREARELFGFLKKSFMKNMKLHHLSPEIQLDGMYTYEKESMLYDDIEHERTQKLYWFFKDNLGEGFIAYITVKKCKNYIQVYIDQSINEEKKIETSIKDIEHLYNNGSVLYRKIFENTNRSILVIDPKTSEIVDVNCKAIDFYGYSREQILSLKVSDINTYSKEKIFEEMSRAVNENRNYFLFKHKKANGDLVDVEVYSFPIKINKNNLLISVITDISEKSELETRYMKMFKASPMAIAILNRNMNVVDINQQFTDLFQYTSVDLVGKSLKHYIVPEEFKKEATDIKELVLNGLHTQEEAIRKRKDGKQINVEIIAVPILYNNEITGITVQYVDITEQKRYNAQLELYRKVFEYNNEGILITNEALRVDWINKAFTDITGLKMNELQSVGAEDVLRSSLNSDLLYNQIWNEVNKKGTWSGEVWTSKTTNKEHCPISLNIFALRNQRNNITNYVAIIKDLSELKVYDEKLRVLTEKDFVTSLYNRKFFINKVNQLLSEFKEDCFSLLFLDINEFKGINESHGHFIGDKILINFSRRIKRALSEHDVFARYSGDKFVLLIKENRNHTRYQAIARLILEIIKTPFEIKDKIFYVTTSIGVSKYPNDGNNSEELIRHSEIAMELAKESKDDQIKVYSIGMKEEANFRFDMINKVRRAITKNEFELCFQPVYNLVTNEIVSSEAILRWSGKDSEPVDSCSFIRIVERKGESYRIGEWMIKQVCQVISHMREEGVDPVPVAINASVKQLENQYFIDMIKSTMDLYEVEPSYIELVITKHVMINKVDVLKTSIKQLADLGIAIIINDFKLDYTWLKLLSELKVKGVRISHKILSMTDELSNNIELLKSILTITDILKLKVVIQGIKTQEELDIVKALDCHYGLGDYLHQAVADEEYETLLSE